jgi:hypothetical protein
VEANTTGGQGSRRAVAPSNDDDDEEDISEILSYMSKRLDVKYPLFLLEFN